jgi:two-component system OmpR family response regulator
MRCLLIEDDAETAGALCRGLAEAGYTAVVCPDGVAGLHRATHEPWDLVILDRLLPGGVDGVAVVATLWALGTPTPVLILRALARVDARVRGLRSGGDDARTTPVVLAEVLAWVEALLRRTGGRADGPDLRVADLHLDVRTRRVWRAGQPIALQPRAFRVLEYLVRHHGQAVTRPRLLEAVWDGHVQPHTNVIDAQISRLRTKIDKDFAPPLLQTVRGVGYMVDAHD